MSDPQRKVYVLTRDVLNPVYDLRTDDWHKRYRWLQGERVTVETRRDSRLPYVRPHATRWGTTHGFVANEERDTPDAKRWAALKPALEEVAETLPETMLAEGVSSREVLDWLLVNGHVTESFIRDALPAVIDARPQETEAPS